MRSGKTFDAEKAFAAMPQSQINDLFHDFLKTIGSVRDDGGIVHTLSKDDYVERLAAFGASIADILLLTEKATRNGHEVFFGITSNADWSKERWASRSNSYLKKGTKKSAQRSKSSTEGILSNSTFAENKGAFAENKGAGATCGEDKVLHVRDQGQCGSCWAFSTAEQLRYDYKRLYGEDPGTLSAQYLVDCGTGPALHGCNGGNTLAAIDFMIRAGGIPTAAAYGPYTGKQGTCKKNVPKKVIPGPSFDSSNEPEMYKYYCGIGPFTISIEAEAGGGVQHYTGGVMSPEYCGTKTDHRVIVVGVYNYKGTWAWVVQNSWGPAWGATETGTPHSGNNGGFILMKYNANTCGLAEEATFIPQVFSVGGKHPWTHSKPLLQWKASWGPYNGATYSYTHGGIRSSTQATLALCEAHTEAVGDDSMIYTPATKSCKSTNLYDGAAGFTASGRGPVATVYEKGNKPAFVPAPGPIPSPHPSPRPSPRPPPSPNPTPLQHTWTKINSLPGATETTPHRTTTKSSVYDCAVYAEQYGNSFLLFYTPSTGKCEVSTSNSVKYTYGSGATVDIYQASATSQFSVDGEEIVPSRVPVLLATFVASALMGSTAVFLAIRARAKTSSSKADMYMLIGE